MKKNNECLNISETLINVFNYAFVESVPYSFFIPTRDKYVAVNLPKKIYHCFACQAEIEVEYQQNGVVYFSKDRFEKQRELYAKRNFQFPDKKALRAEEAFIYHEEGYCSSCAQKDLMDKVLGQEIYHLCFDLHQRDENVVQEARMAMRATLEKWISQIDDSAQLAKYDLSSYAALKDLLCAVILDDLSLVKECLVNYSEAVQKCIAAISDKLGAAPDKWQCYAARPTTIYESMSDELYHEYTVVFPVKETVVQDFYVNKSMEKLRVKMFVEQKRIETVEELIMEAGFMDEWVDLFIDHVTELKK